MNIYAQRLLNVARACRESRNPERFTMRKYIHECGTPACAFGHYALRDDLQDFVRIVSGPMIVLQTTGDHLAGSHLLHHFAIGIWEWEELFGPGGCDKADTPEKAARFIEKFVEQKYPGSLAERDATKFMASIKGSLEIETEVA
jgi:hypothetical protein